MNRTRLFSNIRWRALASVLLLVGGSLLAAEPEESIIAPFPAKSLKATSVVKGTLSCSGDMVAGDYSVTRGQVNYTLKLKPNQSVMAMLRAPKVGQMKLHFTDTLHKLLTERKVIRVGGKIFLVNRLKEDMTIVAVVAGRNAMFNEPYELVICEIDTELALEKAP